MLDLKVCVCVYIYIYIKGKSIKTLLLVFQPKNKKMEKLPHGWFALPTHQQVPKWKWAPSRFEDPAYGIFNFLGYNCTLKELNIL